MDMVLSQMDIDEPSAKVDEDTEMGDIAPQGVQKQGKQKKDKKEKKQGKDKKEKKSGSRQDDAVESKKRKHVEVNGVVRAEGKKKKKKSSVE